MSLRIKLTAVLTACIALATALTSAWFLHVQKRSIESAEQDKTRLVMESAARIGRESALAKDPLMLVDYLAFLKAEHPEVYRCRVFADGKWLEVGAGTPPPEDEDPLHVRRHYLIDESEIPPSTRVQVWFKREIVRARTQEAVRALHRDVAWTGFAVMLLGTLCAVFLGGSLTRRITRVEAAMEEVGRGELGGEVRVRGSDEIARLARRFNDMSRKLRELDQMKKTFVASVTHELRSPLGAIQSQVRQLLKDGREDGIEKARRSLQSVLENASRLEHFVSNLLEMSKIEKGKLEFRPRTTDLKTLIEDTVLFFKPRAQESGLTLSCRVPAELPRLFIDPDLIGQVLVNFISNALKFTRAPGEVKVSARIFPSHQEVSVSDTGVGIGGEDLKRIFAPFERVLNPVKASGAGLGLAISKSIVEMHKGRIGVESKKGQGSRFYFTLPVQAPL